MLARFSENQVRLFHSRGRIGPTNSHHPRELQRLSLDGAWLDGEIVVLRPDGRSSFQALQNAFEGGADSKIVYYVFDALSGRARLRQLPLRERKSRLRKALKASGTVRFSEDLAGATHEILEHASKLGLEGLIGKQADSVYVAGRTRSWIKLKCLTQDFVIAGYTQARRLAPWLRRARARRLRAARAGWFMRARWGPASTRTVEEIDSEIHGLQETRFCACESAARAVHPVAAACARRRSGIHRAYRRRRNPAGLVHGAARGHSGEVGNGEAASCAGKRAFEDDQDPHPDRPIWPELGIRKIDLVRYLRRSANGSCRTWRTGR